MNSTMTEMLNKVTTQSGFIAALDQSGGSTPKALGLYGVTQDQYNSEQEMFDLVHEMRTRIVTNDAFTGERILGAILFENTLDRTIEGKSSAQYLWQDKQVVPFLKVDKGLAEEEHQVQLMKPMTALEQLLDKAVAAGVFGTKMRSVIKAANNEGITKVVNQQFDIARQILAKGLVPIVEPEVDINISDKAEAEQLLKKAITEQLNQLAPNQKVMLKLTLPEQDDFYLDLVEHDNVIKVVALSGGYSREQANQKVANNKGMIASFSRALTEGLSAKQSAQAFTTMLDQTIESIYQASLS